MIELPSNTPEYMRPAYEGLLRWAANTDHIREEFMQATNWSSEMNFIQTGESFVTWVTETFWGDPFSPEEPSE